MNNIRIIIAVLFMTVGLFFSMMSVLGVFPYKRPMTKDGFFHKYEYAYDEYYDCYVCPGNQVLKYSTTNRDGSLRDVATSFGLRSKNQLRKWIKMYNNGEGFSHKMSGGCRMTTSRQTTKEERTEIAKECIANGCNYGEIAIKYQVSYHQVYSWVKRYKELGEAGLEDRRGRRKLDQEPRSELEKLQIENERLKHQLYMAEMERDLLKKLDEQ